MKKTLYIFLILLTLSCTKEVAFQMDGIYGVSSVVVSGEEILPLLNYCYDFNIRTFISFTEGYKGVYYFISGLGEDVVKLRELGIDYIRENRAVYEPPVFIIYGNKVRTNLLDGEQSDWYIRPRGKDGESFVVSKTKGDGSAWLLNKASPERQCYLEDKFARAVEETYYESIIQTLPNH